MVIRAWIGWVQKTGGLQLPKQQTLPFMKKSVVALGMKCENCGCKKIREKWLQMRWNQSQNPPRIERNIERAICGLDASKSETRSHWIIHVFVLLKRLSIEREKDYDSPLSALLFLYKLSVIVRLQCVKYGRREREDFFHSFDARPLWSDWDVPRQNSPMDQTAYLLAVWANWEQNADAFSPKTTRWLTPSSMPNTVPLG